MYCGDRNCYDVLKVKESATVSEITDSYRKLAREWHPDKNKDRREEAEKHFAGISHAYGILKNDDSRRDYNYALRHPEEFAYNQARYYYTQYYTRHFKFDPILVLIISLSLWSMFEYTSRLMCYKQCLESVKQTPEYKARLKKFKEEKVVEMEKQGLIKKKLNGKRSRKDIDAIEVDETELESQIQVHGSYRKPEFKELAIVQFWFLPFYFCKSVSWYARWFYKYNVKKEEYTEEDKAFIVRGILNISERTWDNMEDRTRDKIWARELWIPENEQKYRDEQRMPADLDFDD
eukprot:jgi/Ulvmu1/12056/UM083_0069.1